MKIVIFQGEAICSTKLLSWFGRVSGRVRPGFCYGLAGVLAVLGRVLAGLGRVLADCKYVSAKFHCFSGSEVNKNQNNNKI